jgi:hypothetical protein
LLACSNERGQHAVYIREVRNAYIVLETKSERKSAPERCRHKWEDNIKVDLKEMGYEYLD